MGGVEIQSNATSNATIEVQEWQICNFGELLNLGEIDRYMPLEIQHILALNAAFRSVMPAFRQAKYANTQFFKPWRIVQKYISHSLHL